MRRGCEPWSRAVLSSETTSSGQRRPAVHVGDNSSAADCAGPQVRQGCSLSRLSVLRAQQAATKGPAHRWSWDRNRRTATTTTVVDESAEGRRRYRDRGPLARPDRLDPAEAGQGGDGRRVSSSCADPGRDLRAVDRQAASGTRRTSSTTSWSTPTLADPDRQVRRHQPALPLRCRAAERPGHLQPGRLRRADLPADRLPRRRSSRWSSAPSLGVVAGYFGGWVDTLISRADGRLPRLPAAALRDRPGRRRPRHRRSGSSGDALRIGLLIFIIGFFNWPYIGRIVRGQTLSLREREFVEAARSLGARAPLHPRSANCCPT